MEGYKENVTKLLRLKLLAIKEGGDISHHIDIPKPEHHIADYERVIDMMGLNVETEISFSMQQFAMYMRDEWYWKDDFFRSCNPHGVTLEDINGRYVL